MRFLDAHWVVWEERARRILGVSGARHDSEADTLRLAFQDLFGDQAFGAFLKRIAKRLDKRAETYVKRVLRLPQVDLIREDLIEQFRRHNVGLIKRMADEHIADLEQTLRVGQGKGLRHEQIAKQIDERLNVGRNRARLIARDQTQKITSQINTARQQAAGIEEFKWSTSRDGAVRPSHAELEGRIFRYDNPPIVDDEPTLPGLPVQCRCIAIPIISAV